MTGKLKRIKTFMRYDKNEKMEGGMTANEKKEASRVHEHRIVLVIKDIFLRESYLHACGNQKFYIVV